MKKAELAITAAKYGINPQALKETLKVDGIDRKTATLKDVLECIFINAPALMYCRQDEIDSVEYADPTVCKRLIADMQGAA